MKKGQLFSQPFVYIFAIVVIAFIFIFGFYVVTKFRGSAEKVEFENFLVNLNEELVSVKSLDFGSSKTLGLIVPGKVGEICFFDSSSNIIGDTPATDGLKDALLGYVGNSNIFFADKDGDYLDSRKIDDLILEGGVSVLCDRTLDGRLDILLISDADAVLIKK